MNRIDSLFARLRREKRKALIGYLTAGDPDRRASMIQLRTALQHGVDILELGVPFSDPSADGPVIQAAGQRALAGGIHLPAIIDMVRELRRHSAAPIVLFGYANPFFHYGFDRLAQDVSAAGADGLLIVDIPFEESVDIRAAAQKNDLCLIPLIAPTTPMNRAARILQDARGFVYYIMVKGVTGTREELPMDAMVHLRTLRTITSLPIAAGFGVSTPAQAGTVAREADGVIVGSALVKASQEGRLAEVLRGLRSALDR